MKTRTLAGWALLLAVSGGFLQPDSATAAEAARRPRLGLVLGGGGAKAGTQVGVLRVMEEMRIPVDFVVGTSMGSFIGMLYAMGYPLADIEKVLSDTDWSTVFSDATDRRLRPFRRKQDDTNYLIDFKVGVSKSGLLLPEGIMGTQRLRTLIRELSLHVAHIKDFDKLPLPYRAVSIDISNGTEVVLGSGELPDAVRSSMSLPGIFPPVVIDGKHLVDGGSVNNLPVSVAKANGMDAVIAVDVGADFYKVEDLTSFLVIMDQLTMMLTRGNTLRTYQMAGAGDIIIRPDLTGFTTESYEKISETYERGAVAARAAADKLKKYSVSEAEYAAFKARRERPNRPAPKIDDFRVATGTDIPAKAIDYYVRAKKGEVLDVAKMHEDIERLYATQYFKEVQYDIEGTDEKKTLVVRPIDDERLKNNFRLGLRLETDFKGDAAFGAAGSLYMTRLNKLAAEWRNDAEVGTRTQLLSEFLQPVEGKLRYFIVPEVRLQRKTVKEAVGSTIIAEDVVSSARFSFGVGRYLYNWGELRAGYRQEFGDLDPNVGTSIQPVGNYDSGRYFGKFTYDTLDNLDFPLQGIYGVANWEHALEALGDFDFQKYEGRMIGFTTFGRETFALGLEGAGSVDENLPTQEFLPLGGLFKLSGFRRDAISSQYSFLGRTIYYHRIGAEKVPVAHVPMYLGGSFETGGAFPNLDAISSDTWIYAGSGFIGLDTILGPIILAGGYADSGAAQKEVSAYLLVGQPF